MLKRFIILIALILPLFLAACDTAEERAQKHFEKSLALLEEGEVDRALVELRNVFQLNGYHIKARLTYAQISEDRGNVAEAYSQYLRLVEQEPEHLAARSALARLAATSNNWEEAERHLAVAEPQDPKNLDLQSIRLGLTYRTAVQEQETATAVATVAAANALLEQDLNLPVAQQIAVDALLRAQDWEAALTLTDRLLSAAPQNLPLHSLRLGVLEQLGDRDAVISHLHIMVSRFPEADLHRTLVSRLIEDHRLAEAETYLRDRIQVPSDDPSVARLELLSFLRTHQGIEAAIAELDLMLDAAPEDANQLRALRANLEFGRGNREVAMAELEEILTAAGDSAETDTIKVLQARMFQQSGNSVGARARVEEVLEHDAGHLGALKMKAGWLIQDDQPGDALVELRNALDTAPRDPELLTLMAQAHQRSGDLGLMREMLALATEASGNRPAEVLRYANHLIESEKFFAAEDVLQAALRNQPDHLGLLGRLGTLYIQIEDWPRSQQVITRLSTFEGPAARNLARELTARLLSAQNRAQDLEAFLGQLVESEDSLQASAALIRLRLANGDVAGALQYSTDLLNQDPDNPTLRFLQSGVLATQGRLEPAAEILETLVVDFPQSEQSWVSLYRLRRSQGSEDQAAAILARAAAALPQSANIKWIQASEAEAKGDIDQAIEIYEGLYAQNSTSLVVANNLASLIASYRSDDASLERAFVIARRLRGSEVPAFQDTYGWIATRLGNLEEAEPYLEAAATALPQDPVVRFHLAELYRRSNRTEEARPHYQAVVDLVAAGATPPPFLGEVQAQLAAQN
ncbi:tetratricopeptide repeat protein [Tritonibacter litoralis]|nr:tetratricopeptide repeat protein [Tritonibacter litoralis]